MKKASVILLVVLLIFLGALTGYIAGHRITSKDTIVSVQKLSPKNTEPDVTAPSAFTSDGKIDINIASVAQFMMLPDIGEVLAKRIVDYRTENGPFAAVEDLLLVKGIGEKRLEKLRVFITVGG